MSDVAVLVHQVAVTTAAVLISICVLSAIRHSVKSIVQRRDSGRWIRAEEQPR